MNEKTRIKGIKSKSQMRRLKAQGAIEEECCGCGSLVEPEPVVEEVKEGCESCSGCSIPDIDIHEISRYIPSDTEDDGDID